MTKRRSKATNGKGDKGPDMARTAAELCAEVAAFESLTERLGRLELTSEEKMDKAAALLSEAAASHVRFVEHLRGMVEAIEDVRQRQNRSAAALSDRTEALEARRREYHALLKRFEALGTAAKEISELLRSSQDASDPMARAVTELEGLVVEARAANLTDLEKQADALRQRMQALARKI